MLVLQAYQVLELAPDGVDVLWRRLGQKQQSENPTQATRLSNDRGRDVFDGVVRQPGGGLQVRQADIAFA